MNCRLWGGHNKRSFKINLSFNDFIQEKKRYYSFTARLKVKYIKRILFAKYIQPILFVTPIKIGVDFQKKAKAMRTVPHKNSPFRFGKNDLLHSIFTQNLS